MTEKKRDQKAESQRQTVLHIYANKTLGMLAPENIIEVLPRRPWVDKLGEVMANEIF